jgi:Flp pilus assembly protein TadD
MRRRAIAALFIAIVIGVIISSPWVASSSWPDEGPNAAVSGDAVGPGKGGGFLRAFKAPFRALGRLWGRGGDDNKIRRMTEKDAKKFAGLGVARVDDARSAAAPKSDQRRDGRAALAAGREMLERGKLSEAIGLLAQAVSLDPSLSEAHNLLGVAYGRKGLADLAAQSFERSLRLEPNSAQALNNYGYSLYASGRYRAAVDRLKRAARLAPHDQRILNNLALAQYRLGRYDDAYKSFTQASDQVTGRLNMAALFQRAGNFEEAIKHYEAARRVQPLSPDALQQLADLYRQTDQPEKAALIRRELQAVAATARRGP